MESSSEGHESTTEESGRRMNGLNELMRTPDSSASKKAPKARKSFGATSNKKPGVSPSPSSPSQNKQTGLPNQSTFPTQNVMSVSPLIVNTERDSPPKLQRMSAAAPTNAFSNDGAMDDSPHLELFDSMRDVKTEASPSPTLASPVVTESATSSFSNGLTNGGEKSTITVAAAGPLGRQTVRVVRLPAGSFRGNPQREIILNGLLQRKVAALKTLKTLKLGGAQIGGKRSLSPAKPQPSASKRKRVRKSEGDVKNKKSANGEGEAAVEPPPRRDGRPRRSAAPKSFKTSLGFRGDEERASTSESDGDDDNAQPQDNDEAKPAAAKASSQLKVQGMVRIVHPPAEASASMKTMTRVIPRVISTTSVNFDKSLELLLQSPLSLFQCQLCGIYLPRKDVTLNHIKRLHRVEDDRRAANNCVMVKMSRAQATPLGKDSLRKISEADGGSLSTTKLVQALDGVSKSPKVENANEIRIKPAGTAAQLNLTSKYRCQQCRKLFDNRESARIHCELAHSSKQNKSQSTLVDTC